VQLFGLGYVLGREFFFESLKLFSKKLNDDSIAVGPLQTMETMVLEHRARAMLQKMKMDASNASNASNGMDTDADANANASANASASAKRLWRWALRGIVIQ
jgi:hypothetical protein